MTKPMDKWWTVIIRLPDNKTVFEHVRSTRLLGAVLKLKRRIRLRLRDPDLDIDDLSVVSVMLGSHRDLTPEWKKLHSESRVVPPWKAYPIRPEVIEEMAWTKVRINRSHAVYEPCQTATTAVCGKAITKLIMEDSLATTEPPDCKLCRKRLRIK